jgi:hypothetical protein
MHPDAMGAGKSSAHSPGPAERMAAAEAHCRKEEKALKTARKKASKEATARKKAEKEETKKMEERERLKKEECESESEEEMLADAELWHAQKRAEYEAVKAREKVGIRLLLCVCSCMRVRHDHLLACTRHSTRAKVMALKRHVSQAGGARSDCGEGCCGVRGRQSLDTEAVGHT